MLHGVKELVGRQDERAAVAAFVESVSDGPAALVLEGEPGIGKTTVWQLGVDAAEQKSVRVLSARPAEGERELSFAALGDLLAPIGDEISALPAPQRRALRIALLLEDADGRPPDLRAISLALLGLLRALNEGGPLLVAIDDVQWLDASSESALSFALRRLEHETIRILIAARPGLLAPLGLTRAAAASVEKITIEPLDGTDLDRLLRVHLGSSFPRPTLLELAAATGGNPLFALELGRALLDRDSRLAPGEPLPVPDSLRSLVAARLERLPDPTREGLLAAAALARPTRALVEAALAGSAEALTEAAEAGVVELDSDYVRFSHPLLGSVVYAEASDEARRRLHRRLADVVETTEERARHLALSVDQPDADVAAALDQAARSAWQRGASASAARLAERALALTPRDDARGEGDRVIVASDYSFEAGDAGHARQLLEDRLPALPSGPARARVLAQLATVVDDIEGGQAALLVLREALSHAQGDRLLEAELHARLAYDAQIVESTHAAEPHTLAAVERAEELGEPALLAQALALRGRIEFLLGRGVRYDLFERALVLERETELEILLERRPSARFARVLTWAGEFERARPLMERLRDEAADRADASVYIPLHALADIELLAGNLALAKRHYDEAIEVSLQTGRDANAHNTHGYRAVVNAYLGNADQALADAQLILAPGTPRHVHFELTAHHARGLLELSRGNGSAAYEHLELLLETAAAAGIEDYGTILGGDEIEALIALGRLDDARSALTVFEDKARRLDRPWMLAAAARRRGLLLAASGDRAMAEAAFQEALPLHERAGQPFQLARTLLAQGSVLRRAQKRQEARDALERALDIFEQIGARLWAKQTRAELGRVGGRPPRGAALTETEQRIAELVAAGRSNQEVASALYISPKTVEWNLSKVYRKLHVRSRTELAAKLASNRANAIQR